MNKKYGSILMACGLFLVAISLVTAENLTIIDNGNSTSRWWCSSGTATVSTAQYVSSPSSIAWSTDVASNQWSSYLAFNFYTDPYVIDLTTTPVLTFKIYPTVQPDNSHFTLIIFEEPWNGVTGPTLSLATGTWNTVTLDLRDYIDVTKARHFVIEFGFGSLQTVNMITYVDDVDLSPGAGSPTPTPSPSSSPSPTPSTTPTPAPGETPAPSASPNATEPTPTPTLEPGATPTPSAPAFPSFGTDDLNRMGVFAGLGMFATGAVISFTGRKRK